jgi:hypothetical protein
MKTVNITVLPFIGVPIPIELLFVGNVASVRCNSFRSSRFQSRPAQARPGRQPCSFSPGHYSALALSFQETILLLQSYFTGRLEALLRHLSRVFVPHPDEDTMTVEALATQFRC